MKIFKKILILVFWASAVLGIFVMTGFSNKWNSQRESGKVNVKIQYNTHGQNPDVLITYNDIKSLLTTNFDSLEVKKVHETNIEEIENLIRLNPYVGDCDVYRTINGEINVEIKQRRPIARLVTLSGNHYYIDEEGIIIPTREAYPAKVPLLNGYIEDSYFSGDAFDIYDNKNDSIFGIQNLRQLYKLAKYVDGDAFYKSLVTQLYCNKDWTVDIIPLVGNNIIKIGRPIKIKEKLDKLLLFYKDGMRTSGWEKYKEINVEFKDQIVCTKY